MSDTDRPRAGVVGVGQMGSAHARVLDTLDDMRLVGVADADEDRAASVASTYDTVALATEELLERADVVSVAVPTQHHYPIASRALDRGVHVLVEKPFVADPANGRDLLERAREAGVVLQVGHVERFNPAVRTLEEVVADMDIIAVEARRLGPPLDRDVDTGVTLDLMIHDVDVVCSLIDADVASVDAAGASENRYVDATIRFENGTVAGLTASRVTQQKVRELGVTTSESKVNVDYLDQSIDIHRRSMPEFVETNGDVRYRHESIIERPVVERVEPLKAELAAFVDAVRDGSEPEITGRDGLRALEIALHIERATGADTERIEGVAR